MSSLVRQVEANLAVYYSRLIDDESHDSWNFFASDQSMLWSLPAGLTHSDWEELVRRNLEAPPFRAYRDVDQALGSLVAEFPNATWIVISDHGWNFSCFEHYNAPGILLISGPDVRPGPLSARSVQVEDIAPTLMALLGLPLSEELDGTPILSAFVSPPEVTTVSSYGEPAVIVGGEEPVLDEETLKTLKALGYVQ